MTVRRIDVREHVRARNDEIADRVRRRLAEHHVTAFNLVSGPGAGKTTLLEETLVRLPNEIGVGLIAGEVHTERDARRLSVYTDEVVNAVVTGGGCHMDASQVMYALDCMNLDEIDLLLIENVGNLVCPASWDLGEHAKVVLFAVTEGDDEPLKYPKIFEMSKYLVFSKIDLLPVVDFDFAQAVLHVLEVNAGIRMFQSSAKSGAGMDEWVEFLTGAATPGILR